MKKRFIHTIFVSLLLLCNVSGIYAQNTTSIKSNSANTEHISGLIDSLYVNENYSQLLQLIDIAIKKTKETSNVYNLEYTELLMKKASSLYRLEKAGAADICKEATNIVGKLLGKYNETYNSYVKSLATYCYAEDLYPDCILYENETLDIEEKLNMPLDYERLQIMCEDKTDKQLGVNNVHLLGQPLYDTFGTIIQGQNKEYDNLINARNNYETSKKTTGEDGLDFAKAEEKLALACIAVGDTATAQELLFSATSRRLNSLGENNIEFLRSVLLHADVLAIEGEVLLAQDQGKYVLTKLEEIKQQNSSTYIDALILVGMQYAHMGVNGSPQILKALNIAKSIFGTDSPEYDRARFSYAQILYRTLLSSNNLEGQTLNDIIQLTEDTYSWRKANLGSQHRDFIMSLLALATFYEQNKQYSKSNALFEEFVKSQSSIIKDNFLGMTYEQQRNYWYKFINYYQKNIPCALWDESQKNNSTLDASVCYDATLFSKGILLKSFIAKHQSELIGNNDSYNEFIKNLSYNWKDVKSKLRNGEAAIEFVSFKKDCLKMIRTATNTNGNTKVIKRPVGVIPQSIYGAMILTSESSCPVFVPLCDLNTIGDVEINGHMQNHKLYDIIWKPILPYLRNIKNVYFSPSEDFCNIPLESLSSSEDNIPICDKFNTFRLSSTGVLAEENKTQKNANAVIYGGINYGISLEEVKKANKKYHIEDFYAKENGYSIVRGQRESSDSLEYLPGTLVEAKNITQCFNSSSNAIGRATLIDGVNSTETSVKALSGKRNRVLHIGTHGFYEPDKDNYGFVELKMKEQLSTEDKALMRSGLLFAGAQNFYDGNDSESESDNGVLTAYEISCLDLYGLDLVSLSACQTGLGDVTCEGVFGLQRGFKKAGANSILMSLWKVDDKATSKLMTEFYTNWICKKMSKQAALNAAKKTIRETKGWESPNYWAAFILLDGLN